MSRGTDFIDSGRTRILEANWGESFTVDGIRGSFFGLFSELAQGNTLSEQGLEPFGTGTLTCGKSKLWTPFEGQLVAVRGMRYRIASVTNDPTHWRISLSIPSA